MNITFITERIITGFRQRQTGHMYHMMTFGFMMNMFLSVTLHMCQICQIKSVAKCRARATSLSVPLV